MRLTPHRNRDGEAFYEEACRKGWEGLIAKRADSPYTTARSRDWLKFKCDQAQELVIGGYTAPKGSREELGALLLGYYDGDRLAVRGQGRHRVRPAPRWPTWASGCAPLRRDSPPFADAAAIKERARHVGRAASWWRRWASPSGRATGGCAIRASSGCASTSPPREVVREG